MRILIADDDEDFRAAVRRILTDAGYEVIEASSGVDALEQLAAAADRRAPLPDAVLLDLCMPGFSGLGVLGALRRLRHVPPALIITGFRDSSVDLFAKRLGAARVLHKPVEAEEVMQVLHDLLHGKAGSSQAPP